MKKLLCFLTGVLFVISGMYAQDNCYRIDYSNPNLKPGPTKQVITLSFSHVKWDAQATQYSIRYEFYKKSSSEENYHLMTSAEMDNDFDVAQNTFLALFNANTSKYNGQYFQSLIPAAVSTRAKATRT